MRILNIGSANIDRRYEVKEFVRAGETIAALNYSEVPGGKGLNQSIRISRAGGEVYHLGIIGNDGDMLEDILSKSGVKTEYLFKRDVPNGHAVIQVDENGNNSIIVHEGSNGLFEKETIKNVINNFDEGDICLLQNEINNVDYCIKKAKEKGMKVFFNPSPIKQNIFDYALELIDLFIINELEAEMLSGVKSLNTEEISKSLLSKYPDSKFLITLGEKGSLFVSRNERVVQKAFKVNAIDTTGAGDTYTGYFIAFFDKFKDIKYSMTMASAASALSTTQEGAEPSIPTLDKTEEFYRKLKELEKSDN